MNFTDELFSDNDYIIFDTNLEASIMKKLYKENSKVSYFGKLNFLTQESFMLGEIELFWPLIGHGIKPNIISRDICIFILNKIIEERRLFDGYFQSINSNNIFLSSQVYNIMQKASKENIPVDAIAHRIYRFKRGRNSVKVFDDLKNVIVEYRSTLKKMNLYDNAMITELYNEKLLNNDKYKKIYSKYNFIYINKESNKINLVANIKNIVEEEFNSYFDMVFGLENLLGELKSLNISVNDICIVVPQKRESFSRIIKSVSENIDMKITPVSESESIKYLDSGVFVLSALAIYSDFEFILNDDEKTTFVKYIYKDKNIIDIRINLNKYISEIRSDIIEQYNQYLYGSNSLSVGNGEYAKGDCEFRDEEFIKWVYKRYFPTDELGVNIVSKVCELIREISSIKYNNLFNVTEDMKIKYIKNYLNVNNNIKRRIENIDLGGILLVGISEYASMNLNTKNIILFDATSKHYDVSIESEIDTDIAYLDDDLLGNVDKNNLIEIYNELRSEKIDERINTLIGGNNEKLSNIYILKSDTSIGGYDQENSFYNRFLELARR
ncbi:hypothetical protein [Peptostreptococcus faecalis]|uniref:hypothetical protein n=1 Tax=Peptostreptococcus faecalis TaxID=2045015 RepID=UPI000C7E3AB5|nr:hypothetical protein [Peptostreptococcus faecalis]